MLPFVPLAARKILEVGCGEGFFGMKLKQRQACEVWGIEQEPAAAKAATGRLDRLIAGKVEAAGGMIPDRDFDCIVANDILEHLSDHWGALRMFKQKLQPDGVLVCSVPNVRYWGVLKDLVWHKQWKYTDGLILDKTHLRFFTERSIRETLEQCGYDVLQLQGINPIHSLKLELLNILTLGKLADARYFQFACVAHPK